MKALIGAYDAYLCREAKQPARRRLDAFQSVLIPWALSALFLVCLLSSGVTPWLVLSLLGLIFVGLSWVTARFNMYGAEFDRTPPAAPWTATEKGQILIRTLSRVTLNSLASVTLKTRLREDLKLTSGDLSELVALLRKDCGLDETIVQRAESGRLTVGEVLDGMLTAAGDSQKPGVRTVA